VTVKAVVKNQGQWTASGFYVPFYLSKDTTIPTGDTQVKMVYVSATVAPGAETIVETPSPSR